MAKKKGNLILVQVESYFDWPGDVDDLINRLNSIKAEQWDKGVFDLKIEEVWGGYGPESRDYTLIGYRNETPAEKEKRLAINQKKRERKALQKIKNAERKDESERTTYERLKVKFKGE